MPAATPGAFPRAPCCCWQCWGRLARRLGRHLDMPSQDAPPQIHPRGTADLLLAASTGAMDSAGLEKACFSKKLEQHRDRCALLFACQPDFKASIFISMKKMALFLSPLFPYQWGNNEFPCGDVPCRFLVSKQQIGSNNDLQKQYSTGKTRGISAITVGICPEGKKTNAAF